MATELKFPNVTLQEGLGLLRILADGAAGVTEMAENLNNSILRTPGLEPLTRGPVRSITQLVYSSVSGAFRLTGKGLRVAAGQLANGPDHRAVSREREVALAALNGVLGDYLAETHNSLALKLCVRRDGCPVALEQQALARAFPAATGKLAILVHGLCMSDLQWRRHGHDHGASLGRDFGYTPVYISYNSGLHISANGDALAESLERLIAAWPIEIERLVIVAHSMGGLVARSACLAGDKAGHSWRRRLDKIVFLGTPHHGAPLEKVGNWLEANLVTIPYASAFATLARVRSAGITDLRFGSLLPEEWEGRNRFARGPDTRTPAPLPDDVNCYAIAATLGRSYSPVHDALASDGLVPVTSGLGLHVDASQTLEFRRDRQWVARQTGHLDLLSRPNVYERIATWLEAPAANGRRVLRKGSASRVALSR